MNGYTSNLDAQVNWNVVQCSKILDGQVIQFQRWNHHVPLATTTIWSDSPENWATLISLFSFFLKAPNNTFSEPLVPFWCWDMNHGFLKTQWIGSGLLQNLPWSSGFLTPWTLDISTKHLTVNMMMAWEKYLKTIGLGCCSAKGRAIPNALCAPAKKVECLLQPDWD